MSFHVRVFLLFSFPLYKVMTGMLDDHYSAKGNSGTGEQGGGDHGECNQRCLEGGDEFQEQFLECAASCGVTPSPLKHGLEDDAVLVESSQNLPSFFGRSEEKASSLSSQNPNPSNRRSETEAERSSHGQSLHPLTETVPCQNLQCSVPNPSQLVVIVGGGIGGLATALALQQRGIHCVVYERDTGWDQRRRGYGLTLGPSSWAVIAELGIEADLRAVDESCRSCILCRTG